MKEVILIYLLRCSNFLYEKYLPLIVDQQTDFCDLTLLFDQKIN